MHGTVARRALGGLVPPKIASPKLLVRFPFFSLSSGSLMCLLYLTLCSQSGASPSGSGPLAPLVAFYYKLPKGPAPAPAIRGLKARFFSGKNASATPVLGLIGGVFLVGYTLDYQRASRLFELKLPKLTSFPVFHSRMMPLQCTSVRIPLILPLAPLTWNGCRAP